DARLAGKAKLPGASTQPLSLERRDRREILGAGDNFDPTGSAEAPPAADVSVINAGPEDDVQESLATGGVNRPAVVVEREVAHASSAITAWAIFQAPAVSLGSSVPSM